METELFLYQKFRANRLLFVDFISEIKRIGVSEHYKKINNIMTPELRKARAKKAIETRWSKYRAEKDMALAKENKQE